MQAKPELILSLVVFIEDREALLGGTDVMKPSAIPEAASTAPRLPPASIAT
jgi:hypothetical protein